MSSEKASNDGGERDGAPKEDGSPLVRGGGDASPAWSEADRLAALERYGILDTGRERGFNDIADLASDILDAPIAVVNFIDADRQWFKAEKGIGQDSLPLDVSICRHAILQPGVLVVPDLTKDARFDRNPLVHVEGGLRFYAGALLQTPDGLPLGTVCVLDTVIRPQGITARQERALAALAAQTMAQLELRRSDAAARHQSERLSAMFAQASVGISEISLDGRFMVVNDRLCEILGRERAELLALDLADVTHPGDLTVNRRRFERLAETGEGFSLDKRYVRPDGSIVWANSSVTRLLDERGRSHAALAITADITARKEEERGRAFLLELGDALRPLDEAAAMQAEACRRLGAYLGVSQVGFAEVHADQERLTVHGDWNDGRIPSVVGTWRMDDFGPAFAATMKAGGTVAIPDVERDPRTSSPAVLSAYGSIATRAILDVPLMRAGRIAAMMFVHDPEPRVWSDAEVLLAEDVVARLASAVERARAEAARDRAAALSAAQNRVLELAVSDATLTDTLEAIAATVEDLSPSGGLASILLLDEGGKRLRHRAGSSLPAAYNEAIDGIAIGPDVGSCGAAIHRGASVFVFDIALDPLWTDFRDLALAHGLRACWSIPIRSSRGALLGTFAIYHREPRRPTDSDLEIVDFVVRTAGLVIERATVEEVARRDEVRLRESEERLRLAVDNADVGFWDVDVVNDRLIWPPRTKAMFGIAADALVTMRDFYDGLHMDDREATGAAFAAAADPEMRAVYDVEYRTVGRADGAVRWVAAKGRGVFDATGRCLRVAGTAVEITARREAEQAVRELNATLEARIATAIAEREEAQEALRQSQKMEAMGQLTGGVAHDFNNLLTPIVGSLDLLQRKGLGGEREQRLIAGAVQSAERARTLVQRLLAFARRQPLQPIPVDVGALVTGMGDLVSSTTGPQIKVVVDAGGDLPPAMADPNQLEMAILNLAVNARDAMPDGGTLRISASREAIRAAHRSGLRNGDYLRLSVADTGEGMNEATLARAVEPFFSTKGVGKGTGLGLSMVHGLASQLGGAITIQSRPGLGTNIELWLPQSTVALGTGETVKPSLMPTVSGTALLVDDEELVRMSTADMLGDLGYSVIEAASGEEAMRLVGEGARFDLLVTDHLMPGMTGTELALAVRSARPGVPVLLVSGYAEHDGIDPGLPRLTKPFRKDELAASVGKVADRRGL